MPNRSESQYDSSVDTGATVVLIRGTSPTVREGSECATDEPSLTVGLMPRSATRRVAPHNYPLLFCSGKT